MRYRFLFIPLLILAADRATKWWALRYLASVPTVPILPGLFHLTLVRNTGVAFGLFRGYGLWVTFATLAVLAALAISALKRGIMRGWIFPTGLSMVVGGALGNLIDRVWLGAVVDFLDFRVWPVFNVPDSCITVGAVLMGWSFLRADRCTRS